MAFCFGLANGSVLCQAAREREIPTVLFIRAMELVLQNNRNIPFGHVPFIRGLARTVYAQILRLFSRKTLRRATAVVFQHREQHQAYLDEKLIDSDYVGDVYFLPNNSNPSWLLPRTPYKSQQESVAVMAANLFWNKGFRVVLDAFRVVKKRVPEMRLIILGDGPDGKDIRRYANDINGVEFKGRVNNVNEYLTSARLLLHSMLDEMGPPNIVLEAAGLGVADVPCANELHSIEAHI